MLSYYLMCSISTLLVCSAKSFWPMWVGLEMFNFILIPWMIEMCNKYKGLKIFQYFSIQAMASAMFLLSVNFSDSFFFRPLLITSMVIKLGGFPFHLWVINVVEGMKWEKFAFFMTITKLSPLVILMYIKPEFNEFSLFILGVFIPIDGLSCISMIKLLSYSSLSHVSWMLASLSMSEMLAVFYFMTYWLMFILVCYSFNNNKTFWCLISYDKFSIIEVIIVLCLMGFPPFLGFYPKLFTLLEMCEQSYYIYALMMSISILIPSYLYLKIILFWMSWYKKKNFSFFTLNVGMNNIVILIFFMLISILLLSLTLN